MLTPQEAESHVFPKASFGGYNMLQVDAFLDSLIEDYRTLYQENASLKSKMKVLVEKVEEYRATEDAMRMTLHSAQKMADAMVKEGEAKKQAAIDQIAASVEEKSKAVRAEMAKEEQAVLAKLEQVKKRPGQRAGPPERRPRLDHHLHRPAEGSVHSPDQIHRQPFRPERRRQQARRPGQGPGGHRAPGAAGKGRPGH